MKAHSGEGDMDHPRRVAATSASAFLLAAALYWLGIERRPEGIVAMLQDALAPIYLLPSLRAGSLGGNVNSRFNGFFFGLFAEAYLAVLAVLWLLIIVSRRRSSR
jgi:hypothetical protein